MVKYSEHSQLKQFILACNSRRENACNDGEGMVAEVQFELEVG